MMTQRAASLLGPSVVPPLMAPLQRATTVHEQAQLGLADLLNQFEPISLAQMDGVALLNRTDTKYVFHADQLVCILQALTHQYWVLEIEGIRRHRYHTVYFDTVDFELYRQHHAGDGNRYKVRSRKYVDSGLTCLEVKLKTNTDRTIKHRMRTVELVTQMSSATGAFLHDHLPLDNQRLAPCLQNEFLRITLVNKSAEERLTLDLELQFSTETAMVRLPGVVIAEVKRAGQAHASQFVHLMREHHIRATSFSKYCIGASLLYPDLKHNNFKQHHRLLDKLMQGGPSGSL